MANELPSRVGYSIRADVGLEKDIRRLILLTETNLGQIDAFFCNAGIRSADHLGGCEEVSNDAWERMWNVNVMQTVYVARHLIPKFVERGSGALMVTASAAGLLTLVGDLPYTVTKHAALGLAEWLRISYAQKGVLVSCLCPQAVQTKMLGGAAPTAIWGDTILSPQFVAKVSIQAMEEGKFLVLPHKSVQKYFSYKGKDYEQWIKGMYKIHNHFAESTSSTVASKNGKSKL